MIVVSIVDDKNLGYSLGPAEYLTKPVDRERSRSRPLPMQRHGTVRLLVEDDDEAAVDDPAVLGTTLEVRGGKRLMALDP